MKNELILLLIQLRPRQWVKNILVFTVPILSLRNTSIQMLFRTFTGFIAFCLISSCVYIFNDYMDIEADRKHPDKKYRPLASGKLQPGLALSAGAVLSVISIILSAKLGVPFLITILIYILLNILYTLKLKNIVIIDIMIIAAGFILRALSGGEITGARISPWFLICTMLLALFLAIGKRRQEICLPEDNITNSRKVLADYSIQLLDQMLTIVVTAAIISYALFTFNSGHSIYLIYTLPLIIYGVFRYLYLMYIRKMGGSPEKILFGDRHILTTVLLYVVSVILILYLYG